jgi:hypothetical protein
MADQFQPMMERIMQAIESSKDKDGAVDVSMLIALTHTKHGTETRLAIDTVMKMGLPMIVTQEMGLSQFIKRIKH